LQERHLEFWNEDEWKEITSAWPNAVKRGFATRLRVVQNGGQPASNAKPLKGFAIPLWELWHRDGQRVIYTLEYVTLKNCVFVVDAFEKDSRKGPKMRTSDKTRIEGRARALKTEMDRLKAMMDSPARRGLH
jgi:phage-related protein